MAADERRFRAMGSVAHVIVVDGSAAQLDHAQRRIDDLESRWSRFRDTSELSKLNRIHGAPVVVSEETFELVRRALLGWRATRGRFDPTVLSAMEALGYDRTFGAIDREGEPNLPDAHPVPGCADVELDETVRTITLPAGVRLDPGGIGKGLAADLVARELCAAGAAGALVSLGGDLRAVGSPPDGDEWIVAIEDPDDATVHLATLCVIEGGVATTSTVRRRWRRGGHEVHHVLDPSTGLPVDGPRSVTVVADEAWRAEVVAKAAMVAGTADAANVFRAAGVAGVIVHESRVEAVDVPTSAATASVDWWAA